MLESDHYPLDYFNKWLVSPIEISSETVIDFLDAVNKHAIADDQSAQDYFMPSERWREKNGRFRIYGENQDVFYCFVNEGLEYTKNPSVYFESCLDLEIDYGLTSDSIIDDDHVRICKRFCDFVAFSLAHYICLRMEFSDTLNVNTTGIIFDGPIELDDSFHATLSTEFPNGCTPWLREDVICIPVWGAAFLNNTARSKFEGEFNPSIKHEWA